MSLAIKIPRNLYKNILDDLSRPHDFAFERVGFVFGRISGKGKSDELIILNDYFTIDDTYYEKNSSVGASINSAVIRIVMQKALDNSLCVFHVHCHDWAGKPSLSRTDQKGIIPLIPSFKAVSPLSNHGILLLSEDSAAAWVLSEDGKGLFSVSKISIIGFPIKLIF